MTTTLRISAPRCIGCGAIETWGTCEGGCREERLDLVTAVEFDEAVAAAEATARRIAGLREAVEAIAAEREHDAPAWEHAQRMARAALEGHRLPAAPLEAPEVVTTWSCLECMAVSAPQPCLGICVRLPVDWVPAADYDAARERLDAALAAERRLRGVLMLAAHVAPRDGRWGDAWSELSARASSALGGG